jgi:hypothetical protein
MFNTHLLDLKKKSIIGPKLLAQTIEIQIKIIITKVLSSNG